MVLNDGEQVTITDFLGQAGRYMVVCPLGDGYLADVYLMRDLQTSNPVVVKVLKQRHAHADNKASDFLREADFLQQLAQRPEVVKLQAPGKGEITLDEQTRLPCILQEYVREPYHPLPELVEAGLSEGAGLEICRQFVSLLSHVHTHGIIYTDLKPEHIYWNGTQIKVIDWNVAKDLSTADSDTFREAVAKELTALGRVMYYLFTGRPTVSRVEGPSIMALVSDSSSETHIDFANSTTGEDLSLGTKLIIERILRGSGDSRYPSAASLEQALTQHALRLSQVTGDRMTQTHAAISKGMAALEAADYEDAIRHFEEAVHSTPGLLTQSHLVATRIRQDESLPDPAKDRVEGNLALFRMAFQEGDLTTALDALASSQMILPEHRGLDVLRHLTDEVVEAVSQTEEALKAADYATARRSLSQARTLEPSAAFLQERLQAVEVFETHLQTGEQALEAGQFAEAAAAFGTLLDHMPQSESIEQRWLEAKLGQAQTHLKQGAFVEAQRAYETILERQPENEEAQAGLTTVEESRQRMQQLESRLSQGRIAFRTGDYEKARQCIDAVLELEPKHAGARELLAEVQETQQIQRSRRLQRWLEKGQQAMAEGAYADAIHCFEQAAALDPESEADILLARAEAARARTDQFQALLHKAHAAFRGEDYDAAVQYFEEAIDIYPEAIEARRGLTLARQRQAEAKAQEAQSLLARGRAALSSGDYDEALRYFERASELGGVLSSVEGLSKSSETGIADYIEKTFQIRDLVQSAQAAEERGDLQEALTCYTRAVNAEPLPGLQRQLARIQARVYAANQEQIDRLIERATAHLENAPEQAATWLKQARELDPDHEQVAELLLEAKEQLRRRQAELRRLLEAGEAALRAGDSAAAEQAFADAVALDPEHMEAQAGRAQAQQLQQHLAAAESASSRQEYEGAVTELAKAVEIAPDSVRLQQLWQQTQCDALLQQARQAADGGIYTDALRLIDQALTLNPDHAAAHALKQTIQAEAEATRRAEEAAARQAKRQEVQALMATAEAQLETYKYQAALQAIESALEIKPDDAKLANRRRAVAQEKALHDRAQALMDQGRRFEMNHQCAEAAEAYEVAAQLTPDPGLETEARAWAAQARRNHRRQRWQHLLRRIVGFPFPVTEE